MLANASLLAHTLFCHSHAAQVRSHLCQLGTLAPLIATAQRARARGTGAESGHEAAMLAQWVHGEANQAGRRAQALFCWENGLESLYETLHDYDLTIRCSNPSVFCLYLTTELPRRPSGNQP